MAAKRKPKGEEKQPTYQEQFQARVRRVLAVMQQERIDWRGIPTFTQDGRVGVRVVPVEMQTEGR